MLNEHIKNATTYGELSLKIVKILTENLETGRKSLLQQRLFKKKRKEKKKRSALTLVGREENQFGQDPHSWQAQGPSRGREGIPATFGTPALGSKTKNASSLSWFESQWSC